MNSFQVTNKSRIFTITVQQEKDDVKKEGYKEKFPEEYDFETAISEAGYGKFNIIFLVIVSISGWASIMETSTMSFVSPVAGCDLNLTLQDKGMLNAITFSGMASSALIWGYLADRYGRRRLLVLGYLMHAFFVMLSALSQNYGMLLFSKFMAGLIVCGPYSILPTILAEFHSSRIRARTMLLFGLVNNIGLAVTALLAWAILPTDVGAVFFDGRLEVHSWNVFILASSLPGLTAAFAHAVYVPESPKFLMSAGRREEALEVFRKIFTRNTGRSEDLYPVKALIDEVKLQQKDKHGGKVSNNNIIRALTNGWQQILPLFTTPYLLRIIITLFALFGLSMGFNTTRLWLPQIFSTIRDYKALHEGLGVESTDMCEIMDLLRPGKYAINETSPLCTVDFVDNSFYANTAVVTGVSLFGFLISSTLINAVGEKTLMVILGVILCIFGISLSSAQNSTSVIIISTVYIAFANAATYIILSVTVLLFPTTLRTIAVSLTLMSGRIGSIIGNIIFPVLINAGCLPPFLLVGMMPLVCSFVMLLLPNTYKKPLE